MPLSSFSSVSPLRFPRVSAPGPIAERRGREVLAERGPRRLASSCLTIITAVASRSTRIVSHQGGTMPGHQAVGVGDLAPDFTLPSSTGEMVSLSDFRGKSEVVLFFYPKDNTPGCTAQACAFRDSHEAFMEAGAEVIGISSDSEESHRQFAKLWSLPFLLLSDSKGEVRARYGVSRTLGLFPGRVTYLIDQAGVVRHVFSSQLQTGRHVKEMLARLREVPGERIHRALGTCLSPGSARGVRQAAGAVAVDPSRVCRLSQTRPAARPSPASTLGRP